ncbi:MAG: hypothetical protein JSW60_07950 [Thermoplasmatales archaeon]|nr:MAG: hypothetical protein JSW60_07950 [Thermoplasmatales archaeon]
MLVLLASIVSFKVTAVIVNPGTYFSVGNETYTVNQSMDFESITIASSYIIFNDTGFYISSNSDITITLVYINDNVANAGNGEKVLEFYGNTSSGTIWFNLSGFPASNNYTVNRSGSSIASPTANGSGFISFANSVWSSQLFEIFQQGTGSGDTSSPVISGVSNADSDPLDTNSSFGWVNITCDVSDDVGVGTVALNITNPDGSYNNVSMNGINSYYYDSSTAFSTHGNYSYFIWANDTSDNADVSSSYYFSMPPNWDINNDGSCSVFDYVLISNHYNETGDPGWIREDVDNNGQVKVFDLVLLSEHYGEMWWV